MADEAQSQDEVQVSDVTQTEVFEGEDQQWYWHGKAANGEIVAQGEGFNTRENATRAAEDAFPGIPCSVSTMINEDDEAEAEEG